MSPKASKRYLNRELSWLEFNQRVLDEARSDLPLLERLKFLAITDSNLDEFFMVRVGGLIGRKEAGVTARDPTGMTPAEQLAAISERVHEMVRSQYECFQSELEPSLAEAGIHRAGASDLTDQQLDDVRRIFEAEIATVLTPMAVDADQFPLLSNKVLNLLVRLAPDAESDQPRFAIIPFFKPIRRFLTLQAESGYAYILVEDVVSLFVEHFFPGESVQETAPFRISRNADMGVREDLAPDLMSGMEEVLDARKAGRCVRLQISDSVSEMSLDFLRQALEVDDASVFLAPGPLEFSAFMELAGISGFEELRYKSWPPQPSPLVDMTNSMFDVIARGDVLLVHPYDSFDPIVKLIDEAADDPDVLSIKQILYRTSRNSPIVAALKRAAVNGKYVTVIVELKARFDEARNIEWARSLEQEGVQVIYGVKGLKTHAKLCLIVRRGPHGIQRYMHFGTGNYNESTARLYSDVSYMTCDEELGADATSFLNAITGFSQPQEFNKIEMAPIGLRQRILDLIESETRRKKQGQRAHIAAKLNSLVDPKIIDALYAASEAGVKIRLNIRGICCLRPGVPGLSENISVVSIIDRYLEHARIFYFYHGGDELVYISSADWMQRNLDRRVELLVPIADPTSKQRLISVLDVCFRDTIKARKLLPDGGYEPVKPAGRRKKLRSQEVLYEQACEAVRQAVRSRRLVFEPHRGLSGDD